MIKVREDSVSGKSSLPGLLIVAFFLPPHKAFFLQRGGLERGFWCLFLFGPYDFI